MRRLHALGWMLVAGMTLAPSAGAQRPAPRLGVLGGINFANLGGKDAEDFKSITGLVGGGFAELAISEHIALRPEALYSMKGAKQEQAGTDFKVKVNYIEIPVLLQFRVPPRTDAEWAVSPRFYFGPALAFKASCKGTIEDAGVEVEVDCDELDDEVSVKSTDFGAIAGAALAFGPLELGARYNYGLSKIIDDVAGEDDVMNRVLSVYAAFSFRLR